MNYELSDRWLQACSFLGKKYCDLFVCMSKIKQFREYRFGDKQKHVAYLIRLIQMIYISTKIIIL